MVKESNFNENEITRFNNLLLNLVKIPSVSAIDDPEDRYSVISYVSERLNNIGFINKQLIEYNEKYPILIAKNYVNGNLGENEKILLVIGHLDVQPPGNVNKWNKIKDPFNPQLIDGKIYGRGSLDTKSQVAAMLSALTHLRTNKKKIRPIMFIFTTDEEIGSDKSTIRFFNDYKTHGIHPMKFIGAINGENTNERFVLGCKGIIKIQLKCEDPLGRTHSGKSMLHKYHPIIVLGKFLSSFREGSSIQIPELKDLNPKIKFINNHDNINNKDDLVDEFAIKISKIGLKTAIGDFLWNKLKSNGWDEIQIAKKYVEISFNPENFISGSSKVQSIVPGTATSDIDIRLPPRVDPKLVLSILKEKIQQHDHISMKLKLPALEEHFDYFKGTYTKMGNNFIQDMSNKYKNTFGLEPVIMPFSSGTSDDRFLGALGIPHVKFGARGGNNHSYDEYVELKSYHRVILFYFIVLMQNNLARYD